MIYDVLFALSFNTYRRYMVDTPVGRSKTHFISLVANINNSLVLLDDSQKKHFFSSFFVVYDTETHTIHHGEIFVKFSNHAHAIGKINIFHINFPLTWRK